MMKNPKYVNSLGGIEIEQEDGVSLYVDTGALYERILAGEFGEIAPAVLPPEIDPLEEERARMVASRFQAKAALYHAGLLPKIEELLIGAGNFLHKLAWDESTEFHRDSPTLNFLAKAAGLSESDLDDLFRLAMTIRA